MSKRVAMRYGVTEQEASSGGSSGTGSSNITNVSASATTLEEGSPATASATLSDTSLAFVFGIPEGATGATGPQGVQGERGETGPAGDAATISVGTVTTGAEGSSASVTNSGTASAAVFDFVIPRGDTGATGATGPQGPQGEAGESAVLGVAYDGTYTGTGQYGSSHRNTLSFTTPPSLIVIAQGSAASCTLRQGITSATVEYIGGGTTAHYSLVVAWSNNGKTVEWYSSQNATQQLNEYNSTYHYVAIGSGQVAATVDVGTVTTGAAGSSASVTNSGTNQQAVLDFVIPRGDTGNGIASIAKTGTSGLVDTYTITFTDGTTTTFTVTNGQNGTGSGDMEKSTYDTDDDGYVDAVEDALDPGSGIEFSLDANGKGQYRAVGASAWIPFLSGPTYTRLWTNGSPSATFAAQNVTLAAGAETFDGLRIVWAYNNSIGAAADTWENYDQCLSITYGMEHYDQLISGNSRMRMGVVQYATSYYYMRGCWLVPSGTTYTTMHFDQVYRANNSNTDNTRLIPLLIDGVTY